MNKIMKDGFFNIKSVHRNDLENLGFDTSEITDNEMKQLANKLANDYAEQLFHQSLEIIANDYFEFPKYKRPLNELEDVLKSDFRSLERKDEITDSDIHWVVGNLMQIFGEELGDEIEERVRDYYL